MYCKIIKKRVTFSFLLPIECLVILFFCLKKLFRLKCIYEITNSIILDNIEMF